MAKRTDLKKTTTEDFRRFKKHCLDWRDRLGLGEWELYFEYKKLKDDEDEIAGQVAYEFDSFKATIFFSTEIGKNMSVEEIALHEVLHLALSPISRLTGQWSWKHVVENEHKVINHLCRALLKWDH